MFRRVFLAVMMLFVAVLVCGPPVASASTWWPNPWVNKYIAISHDHSTKTIVKNDFAGVTAANHATPTKIGTSPPAVAPSMNMANDNYGGAITTGKPGSDLGAGTNIDYENISALIQFKNTLARRTTCLDRRCGANFSATNRKMAYLRHRGALLMI